jgi:hypothetical protein
MAGLPVSVNPINFKTAIAAFATSAAMTTDLLLAIIGWNLRNPQMPAGSKEVYPNPRLRTAVIAVPQSYLLTIHKQSRTHRKTIHPPL